MAVSIAAVLLRCPDPQATAAFYARAFGCGLTEGPALRLGSQLLLLRPAAGTARRDFAGFEAGFQHCAIAVPDMASAMRHLTTVPGWTAISRHGPERLPLSSGGVTAFKFRDPDGHPLELLQFPPDAVPPAWRGATALFAGIDHSAISIADTAHSVAFYNTLGFVADATQLNHGPEQARLDGLDEAVVEVTALRPGTGGPPHLELLCYRRPVPVPAAAAASSAAATAVLLHGQEQATTDPDGHRLCPASPDLAGSA